MNTIHLKTRQGLWLEPVSVTYEDSMDPTYDARIEVQTSELLPLGTIFDLIAWDSNRRQFDVSYGCRVDHRNSGTTINHAGYVDYLIWDAQGNEADLKQMASFGLSCESLSDDYMAFLNEGVKRTMQSRGSSL